jgi:hypothetical protein
VYITTTNEQWIQDSKRAFEGPKGEVSRKKDYRNIINNVRHP